MLLHRLFGGRLPQLVMFDLDGTLADSIPDLAYAIDEMLVALNQPAAGTEKTRLWVGNGVPVLVQRALADAGLESSEGSDMFSRALDVFSAAYDRCCGCYSTLYPGVREALEALHKAGITLAVITNKSERFTGSLLEHLQIDGFFATVVCGDTLPERKPDPAPLHHVMEMYSVNSGQALMVGGFPP